MSVSPQLRLVQQWGQGFQTGDLDLLEKYLHDDYRHVTYPKSVGEKTHNKDSFIEQVRLTVPNWTNTKSTTHSVTEAPGKVICRFTTEVTTKDGLNAPRKTIFIATVATNSDGVLKIKQVEEFVDSKARAA